MGLDRATSREMVTVSIFIDTQPDGKNLILFHVNKRRKLEVVRD